MNKEKVWAPSAYEVRARKEQKRPPVAQPSDAAVRTPWPFYGGTRTTSLAACDLSRVAVPPWHDQDMELRRHAPRRDSNWLSSAF